MFVAGDYKNIFFFSPREITVMRDSSRDFSPGKYDPFYIPKKEERKKENEKGREKREKEPQRYQKSFTTDRAKILKSIKIIECKTTIGLFFFYVGLIVPWCFYR